MNGAPKTSVTLLKAISNDHTSKRWDEFFNTYKDLIANFVKSNYPAIEADDVVQETLKTLAAVLPKYCYPADGQMHFHNYLLGIAKYKALNIIRKRMTEKAAVEKLGNERISALGGVKDEKFRIDVLETAMKILLDDPEINQRDREVFRHLIKMRESPKDVADKFGIKRNHVDQIKARLTRQMQTIAEDVIRQLDK